MDALRERLAARYLAVRAATEELAAPLSAEDQLLQSMPDCSPTKWHRAHTTWFFEEFLLAPHAPGWTRVDPTYAFLFNSYYDAIGERHPRPQRGLLSRPPLAEVARYREQVDQGVLGLLARAPEERLAALLPVLELGLAHEEQHQELLLTDILHAFSQNPTLPAYRSGAPDSKPPRAQVVAPEAAPLRFVPFEGGLVEIGTAPTAGFAFDNEGPRHRAFVAPFELGSRLATCGELRGFIEAGGYRTPSLWLSAGFDFVQADRIAAPLHARLEGGALVLFGLDGERQADPAEPASHLSFYEADALARFLGARLPTEQEWEVAAAGAIAEGNFREGGALRPLPATAESPVPAQLFGDCWEWTASAYSPYPGYRAATGALGEYNGKFMVGQLVLRGGSCFTPRSHVRPGYRNFFPPATRFQLSGARLARDP